MRQMSLRGLRDGEGGDAVGDEVLCTGAARRDWTVFVWVEAFVSMMSVVMVFPQSKVDGNAQR